MIENTFSHGTIIFKTAFPGQFFFKQWLWLILVINWFGFGLKTTAPASQLY